LPGVVDDRKEQREQKVGRPADPNRRTKTLAAATDYVLEHGLAGLSLRPLASALGTSTRMLLYDFDSKDELIMEVLTEVRRRESSLLAEHLDVTGVSQADLVRVVWRWISSEERAGFLRLFFEVYVDAMSHPDAYSGRGRAMVTEWLDQLGSAVRGSQHDGVDSSATLMIAVVRGLLLDRLNTGDEHRTDRALECFARLLDQS
jgi:AcrR family transcriptional regulator